MTYRRGTVRPSGVTLMACVLAAARLASGQTPEFRAMWASRFEWPNADPNTCRATIDRIMDDLAGANFNAVFFQIRGQADVLYPSPYETWSPLLGETNPGWDPLAHAIAAAHARGIEFHAYINAHTCWQSAPASAHTLPADPNHLFYRHCNASDPQARDWLHHNTPDNPVQFSESDYVWITPGVPAYQAYFRQQVLYVVEHYDVDGVHFDRIRTPWSNQPSYDPISLARFADPQSNPGNLDFTRWTADQITRMVTDVYAAIMAVKPQVKVSAAVYSNPSTAPSAQHQDALAWARAGAMDMLVPMMYFTGGAGSTWDTRLQQWLAGCAGRHVVAGHITSQGLASLLEQIALTRTRGAQGNSVFSWSSFSWWNDYRAQVYTGPVPPPTMSWKSSPNVGIVYGYVTDTTGAPLVDVQVRREGSDYVALSSGDGFYSFLLVPPGTYALTASRPPYPPVVASGVAVNAGAAVRRDIVLGEPMPPIIGEVTPDPDSAVARQEYVRRLTLSQGMASAWVLMTGPPGANVDQSGRVSGWHPRDADVGRMFEFAVRAANAYGYDDEGWRVLVTPGPACSALNITGFEGYANGTQVLFRPPRYSGSTSAHLLSTPNVAEVTDAVPAYSGSGSCRVQWQWVDASPQRWMRLTTHNAANVPNPTVALDRPIRVRLRLDAGRLRLAIGIRETGTTAELGQDGGTSGTIEWVGVTSDVEGAPQGRLVEALPGVWQTFVFDPASDPIYPMTGDGALYSANNRGVFEHLAFSLVDSAGPFTAYVDDVDLLCPGPESGDLNGDGQVTAADFELLVPCLHGPDTPAGVECLRADADADGDVDLADFTAFQVLFAGAGS